MSALALATFPGLIIGAHPGLQEENEQLRQQLPVQGVRTALHLTQSDVAVLVAAKEAVEGVALGEEGSGAEAGLEEEEEEEEEDANSDMGSAPADD